MPGSKAAERKYFPRIPLWSYTNEVPGVTGSLPGMVGPLIIMIIIIIIIIIMSVFLERLST